MKKLILIFSCVFLTSNVNSVTIKDIRNGISALVGGYGLHKFIKGVTPAERDNDVESNEKAKQLKTAMSLMLVAALHAIDTKYSVIRNETYKKLLYALSAGAIIYGAVEMPTTTDISKDEAKQFHTDHVRSDNLIDTKENPLLMNREAFKDAATKNKCLKCASIILAGIAGILACDHSEAISKFLNRS